MRKTMHAVALSVAARSMKLLPLLAALAAVSCKNEAQPVEQSKAVKVSDVSESVAKDSKAVETSSDNSSYADSAVRIAEFTHTAKILIGLYVVQVHEYVHNSNKPADGEEVTRFDCLEIERKLPELEQKVAALYPPPAEYKESHELLLLAIFHLKQMVKCAALDESWAWEAEKKFDYEGLGSSAKKIDESLYNWKMRFPKKD